MDQFARRRQGSFRTLYRTIVELCRTPLTEGVATTNADHYVKRYPSAEFALALMLHFVLGLQSLRQLAIHLAEDSRLTRLIGMRGISSSHLPKLLHKRPAQLWTPLIEALMSRLRPGDAPPGVWAIDATFLTVGAKLLSRVTGRKLDPENAGAKLSAVVNLSDKRLAQFHISLGSGHDAEHTEQLLPETWEIAELTFVFDRGYRKYAFYRDLIRRGAHFVTRQSANDHFEPQQAVALDPAHPEIVSDQIGLLGGTTRPAHTRMRLRRIVTRCERGEMVFLTTHLDLSAAEVCALYQQRWIIEIFFRWLKSNVNLKRPLGYGPEAAMHTIFAALAAYCLALLLADWELSPTTSRPVPRIARSMQTIRARLYEQARTDELQALRFL